MGFLLKAQDLQRTGTLFEVRTGSVIEEKMLKMQDDPDELLKRKGKLRGEKLDPDGCMKIKELLELLGLCGYIIESKYSYQEYWQLPRVAPRY